MSPNKQGRKQRTRGKNNSNITRERTVLTLAEDPAAAPPYMLPTQPSFTPTLGNMFAKFHQQQGQQQPSSVSIPDMTGFQFQQQSNMMHPFGQGSPFFNHMTQPFHSKNQAMPPQQSQQQNSGEVSDLEKLRKLKNTILAGQHPFFKPVPNPDALANLYLGPNPASQAYQQQHEQQPAQPSHGSDSQAQAQSENAVVHKSDSSLQSSSASVPNVTKRPQTPNASSGLGPSRTSGFLHTPQSMPPSASFPAAFQQQAQNAPNGTAGATRNDNNGKPPPSVSGSSKTHDFRPNTPSPLPPSNTKPSAVLHQHTRGPPPVHFSGASGAHQEDRAPPPSAPSASLNNGPGADKPSSVGSDSKDNVTPYTEVHPDAPSSSAYDRDRDRDRDRPGYPPYDVSRYPQTSDRRDAGRFAPRYPDSRYDRDRNWERGRDWDRDRERDREKDRERDERERDRDRRRLDEKPTDDRRPEYDRAARLSVDRRLPPPTAGSVERKAPASPDQRPVPGLTLSPQRRPEVPAHPEQRHSEVPHPEQQQRRPDPVVPRAGASSTPTSVEQRRPDPPFPNQSPHDRDRFRVTPAPGLSRPPPPANMGVHQPLPPALPLFRSEHRPVSAGPAEDRGGVRNVLSDQRTLSGNSAPRPGHSSPESHRRPEALGLTDRGPPRPPVGSTMDDSSASRAPPERRLTHPGDPPPPPRVSIVPESRAAQQGHDERDVSRPFYSHAPPPPPPRAISRVPSPGPRRPVDSPYDGPRDRPAPSTSFREPPPPPPPGTVSSRSYPDDLRRQSLESNVSRRTSENYYPPPPPPPASSIVEQRRENESRQWRERDGYGSASYPATDAERERAHRFPDTREWHGDAYGRERVLRADDPDGHPRSRPAQPASWDRDRPVDTRDKDKERDRYEGWTGKYTTPDAAGPPPPPPPPPRWEEPPTHRPLHSRLTDTYDERFIPRDAERGRYPPLSSAEDVSMRDNFRENPRVRPRSPSPPGRPSGGFDDVHRAKRTREDYEPPPRAPYYDDTRRTGPAPEYGGPRVTSPVPYYDARTPAPVNPREPSPYARDRAPDPYTRRPSFFSGRERYPPR